MYYESSAVSALSLAMCRRFSYIILCNPKQKGKKNKTPKQNSLKKVSLARQSVGGKRRGRDGCRQCLYDLWVASNASARDKRTGRARPAESKKPSQSSHIFPQHENVIDVLYFKVRALRGSLCGCVRFLSLHSHVRTHRARANPPSKLLIC